MKINIFFYYNYTIIYSDYKKKGKNGVAFESTYSKATPFRLETND